MVDLVGTVPKSFWREWIAEGDAAGEPYSGEEWAWFTRAPLARLIRPGDRFYIVAHGRLRGYAPVTRIMKDTGSTVHQFGICREGDAVACTIPQPVRGFQGLRRVWWLRGTEQPFPDWRTP